MATFIAMALTMLGCVFLYLASPHQAWMARPVPRRRSLAAGGLVWMAGLATAMAAWRPLCGVFMTLHVAMVCLMVFPYAAALRRFWRSN